MHDHAVHDDSIVTPTHDGSGAVAGSTSASRMRGSAGARRLFAVLVLTVVGLTGAVGTATASVGQPTASGSPATVTKPPPGNEDLLEKDDEPCDGEVKTKGGQVALICPDWSPNGVIDVFESPDPTSKVIGHINPAGDDFYFCQTRGDTHRLGKFV